MSADNGWLLRRNTSGKFVLQMYFASSDFYPKIDDPKAKLFDNVNKALDWHETNSEYSEYGLTIKIKNPTE